MKTTKAAAATTKPVDVVLTVTRFKPALTTKPIAGGNATAYVMKLARSDPRASVEGDTLYINRPGAPVRFTLAASGADRQNYYPLGIAYVRLGAASKTDAERLGFVNFPPTRMQVDGETLTVVDTYADRAPDVKYKFSVFIQRGGDGAVGIIDPEITHTGDQ